MIYITQIIYIHEDKEDLFLEFEKHAIPLMNKYNGKLIHRIRPNKESYIDGVDEIPYEIHFISFDSQDDLNCFMKDDSRNDFVHLKNESVRSSRIVIGN
ncbi:MAG: DUF1330 domain-containing protein [Bacteroidetes bacterium]|nr:MAG: DUF1330 domain-containing protein [Bacteroidota bacterium]